MSDGNFNRALLPHTPYQSGLKAGKSMCRMHALNLLREMLPTIAPHLDDQQRANFITRFEHQLNAKL